MNNQSSTGAVHLSQSDFQATLDQAMADGKPVFVDFFAEWCGPCKMAAPIVDKLADELREKIVIAKLDVDQNNQIAAEHGVMSIPTVIIFDKNGDKMEEVDRKIGFPGEDGYRQMISQAIK